MPVKTEPFDIATWAGGPVRPAPDAKLKVHPSVSQGPIDRPGPYLKTTGTTYTPSSMRNQPYAITFSPPLARLTDLPEGTRYTFHGKCPRRHPIKWLGKAGTERWEGHCPKCGNWLVLRGESCPLGDYSAYLQGEKQNLLISNGDFSSAVWPKAEDILDLD